MLDILWIYLDNLKYPDFLASLKKLEKKSIIFTPNPEIILKTLNDSEFKEILNKADYLVPDGIGIYLAYQIIDLKYKMQNIKKLNPVIASETKQPINNDIDYHVAKAPCNDKKENTLVFIFYFLVIIFLLPYFIFNIIFRKKYLYNKYWDKICWSDLTRDLLEFANDKNIKITIIDLYNPTDTKKVESQQIFSEKLKEVYKTLDFNYFIYDEIKKEETIENIKNSNSKILFSTLWMKKQEKSIIEIMEKCENMKIWVWIWSSFDYIIWFQKRAPKIWRTIWLEWLYRLITWPQKINRLKRLYNAIFVFIYKVIIN